MRIAGNRALNPTVGWPVDLGKTDMRGELSGTADVLREIGEGAFLQRPNFKFGTRLIGMDLLGWVTVFLKTEYRTMN